MSEGVPTLPPRGQVFRTAAWVVFGSFATLLVKEGWSCVKSGTETIVDSKIETVSAAHAAEGEMKDEYRRLVNDTRVAEAKQQAAIARELEGIHADMDIQKQEMATIHKMLADAIGAPTGPQFRRGHRVDKADPQ